jgi:orotidine-5'-phosphate decarboxylase
MRLSDLHQNILRKRSFLCVGLDSDLQKLPPHLLACDDPMFEFNRQIVDATAPYSVAYKPNAAFYEAHGTAGWRSLARIVGYIRHSYPDLFVIVDAKRGDIGNTSQLYARAFFEAMDAHAVTLSPYMGRDTVQPFLEYENRWAVLLALTSNASAADFEQLTLSNGKKLYEQVLETSKTWGSVDNTMYVVGATQAESLRDIRKIVPDHFLLVPGVGAQGGSLAEVAKYGMNSRCGLLVNSSRAIIFANGSPDFARVAGEKAREMREEMAGFLESNL